MHWRLRLRLAMMNMLIRSSFPAIIAAASDWQTSVLVFLSGAEMPWSVGSPPFSPQTSWVTRV
jgi:hypothetical protein